MLRFIEVVNASMRIWNNCVKFDYDVFVDGA